MTLARRGRTVVEVEGQDADVTGAPVRDLPGLRRVGHRIQRLGHVRDAVAQHGRRRQLDPGPGSAGDRPGLPDPDRAVAGPDEHRSVPAQHDRARLRGTVAVEHGGVRVRVEDRHLHPGEFRADARRAVAGPDAADDRGPSGRSRRSGDRPGSCPAAGGRERPSASTGSGVNPGREAFSTTSRTSSTAASVTGPAYRTLLRGGSAGSGKLRLAQTGPASISSTADSAVTPHSGAASVIAQSSDDGPRSPTGPGWMITVGRDRHTSSGTRSRRKGQTISSGSRASTARRTVSSSTACCHVTSCPGTTELHPHPLGQPVERGAEQEDLHVRLRGATAADRAAASDNGERVAPASRQRPGATCGDCGAGFSGAGRNSTARDSIAPCGPDRGTPERRIVTPFRAVDVRYQDPRRRETSETLSGGPTSPRRHG